MAVFLTGEELPGIAADVLFDVVFVRQIAYETEGVVMVLGRDVHGAVGDIVLERCMCIGVRAVQWRIERVCEDAIVTLLGGLLWCWWCFGRHEAAILLGRHTNFVSLFGRSVFLRWFVGVKDRDKDTRENKKDDTAIDGHDRGVVHVYYYVRRYLDEYKPFGKVKRSGSIRYVSGNED